MTISAFLGFSKSSLVLDGTVWFGEIYFAVSENNMPYE